MKKNLAGEPAPQMATAKCLTAWGLHLIARHEEKQRDPCAVKRPAGCSTFFYAGIQDVREARFQ